MHFNTLPTDFLKWICLGLTIRSIFLGYQNENLKLISQQYRAWSDCIDVQGSLALYWWQANH
jgi:hypothetical protein